jgi:hypothetical protein
LEKGIIFGEEVISEKMDTKEKGKILAHYLQTLSDFEIVRGANYDHMGAIFVDAMLQAGVNYDGVKERVNTILNYSKAVTTSGFLELLSKKPTHSLLQWEGRKPLWVLEAARFFQAEGVENKSDLKKWLESSDNIQQLYSLKGMGNKTVDYLKKLAGISNNAIDRHWYSCLELAGISFENYQEAKQIADSAAGIMGVDKSSLDTSVWRYFRKIRRDDHCS